MITRISSAACMVILALGIAACAAHTAGPSAATRDTPPATVLHTPTASALTAPDATLPAGATTSAPPAATAPVPTASGSLASRVAALPVIPSATAIGVPVTFGAGAGKVVTAPNPDGCDRAYGTAGQCVPLRAAGGGPVTCAYLTAEGFFRTPLEVHADPLGLMGRHNVLAGTAPDGALTLSGCTD